MRRTVISREAYLGRWQELHGGYDPRSSRWVGPWLSFIYALARPLARVGVVPDSVTVFGGVVSAAVAVMCWSGGRWVLLAAFVVGAAGILDSLDGAVAVVSNRVTRWGAVLDSLTDRVSDGLYLLALWLVGAPAGLCVAAGALMALLEFVRARAAAVGLSEVGVITVGERPTRVAVVAMFLLGSGIYVGSSAWWAAAGAWASLAVGIVALFQLVAVVRHRLS
ncbi:MAG: CDP-alcohol phosphatidyltransferase family protein [Actinobacteria bacterium]|nr:CDP-alcohol phosphatidyltransferase family protein [Actinomycetota bacterium]MSW37840.1 CDP-alcohol phosphatidyltransferase family protein [Actinomycetota bacterium]